MAYDRRLGATGASAFGPGGVPISLAGGDFTVTDVVKGVAVVAAGNVAFRTLKGDADIIVTDAPVGWVLPWHIDTIRQAGTTAALATIEG